MQNFAPNGPLTGQVVLVAEDDGLLAMVLEEMLEEAGAVVRGPFSTSADAISFLDEPGGPDVTVALLDLNLKGGTSHAVADLLAARGVPLVFCTGSGAVTWGRNKMAPPPPILRKPYDAAQLVRTVHALVCAEATTLG